ncbi:hypothetical protein D3OALGA1CA_3446 [Olavius algarvensis associated proteobacterium Delta 3]|nr:hypothetical protein D3OALGA1CA_3446 [Olavius algarvensis associated proteobacterium Delta 3]CAB5162496.1 hypothetical protein D3OALGB2SA_5518 [Olavius algarvensis associated proteobacterium Delta 3]
MSEQLKLSFVVACMFNEIEGRAGFAIKIGFRDVWEIQDVGIDSLRY